MENVKNVNQNCVFLTQNEFKGQEFAKETIACGSASGEFWISYQNVFRNINSSDEQFKVYVLPGHRYEKCDTSQPVQVLDNDGTRHVNSLNEDGNVKLIVRDPLDKTQNTLYESSDFVKNGEKFICNYNIQPQKHVWKSDNEVFYSFGDYPGNKYIPLNMFGCYIGMAKRKQENRDPEKGIGTAKRQIVEQIEYLENHCGGFFRKCVGNECNDWYDGSGNDAAFDSAYPSLALAEDSKKKVQYYQLYKACAKKQTAYVCDKLCIIFFKAPPDQFSRYGSKQCYYALVCQGYSSYDELPDGIKKDVRPENSQGHGIPVKAIPLSEMSKKIISRLQTRACRNIHDLVKRGSESKSFYDDVMNGRNDAYDNLFVSGNIFMNFNDNVKFIQFIDRTSYEVNNNVHFNDITNVWKDDDQGIVVSPECEQFRGKFNPAVLRKVIQKSGECDLKGVQAEYENIKAKIETINIFLDNSKRKPVCDYKIGTGDGYVSGFNDLRDVNGANFRVNPFSSLKTVRNAKIEGDKLVYNKGSEAKMNSVPSLDYIMNVDYLYSDSIVNSLSQGIDFNSKPLVQELKVNQFQPYQTITLNDVLLKFTNTFTKILSVLPGKFTKNIVRTGGKLCTNRLINNALEKQGFSNVGIYQKYSTENDFTYERQYFTSDPVKAIHNMFANGGKWLNFYTIPYFGNDYLDTTNAGSWSVDTSKGFYGAVQQDSRNGNGMKSVGVDFPSNPVYKANITTGRKQVSTEFYLLNINQRWLKKNFMFIHAFFAGSNWLHLPHCIIRPPNVYHVQCPGRFRIYWASMNMSVSFQGKLRKNPGVSRFFKQEYGINSIDQDMLYPDAWKVKITFTDLTNQMFNLYADYYNNGVDMDVMQKLDSGVDIWTSLNDTLRYIKTMAMDMDIENNMEQAKTKFTDVMKVGTEKYESNISEYGDDAKNDIIAAVLKKAKETINGKPKEKDNEGV